MTVIVSTIKNGIDRLMLKQETKVDLGIAPMSIIVDVLKSMNTIDIGEIDENGWQSDYFKTVYLKDANMYMYIMACGYTGESRIQIITEDEALANLSYDELLEAVEDGLPRTEYIEHKLLQNLED